MALVRNRPRFLRLQFSLRALLLAITLVAAGLTAYRWPWTVETTSQTDWDNRRPTIVLTPYRRTWNGKPEKHGTGHSLELQDHWGVERLYSNGDLIHEWVYLDGHCVRSQRYTSGNRSIAQPIPAAREVRGVRRSTSEHDDETVTQICPWRNYERHGLSTWISSNGETLQTAEFERGRIVKWNGKPVGEALEQWLDEHIPDPALQASLLARFTTSESYTRWSQNRQGYLWWRVGPTPAVVHYGIQGPTKWMPSYKNRPVIEVVLQMALGESATLDVRYGTLCVVPICSREFAWSDPTNYTAMKFPAGSSAAKDWQKPVHAGPLSKWPARELKLLFKDKAIAIDTTAVDGLDAPLPKSRFDLTQQDYDFPRPLRDLFGHVLNDAGYRCEQRGDTIVVLPQRGS